MNNTDCVIIGNGSYSVMLKKYIEMTSDWKVRAFAVDAEFVKTDMLDELPVISFEELRKSFSPSEISLVLGVGYVKMGDVRKSVFERCKSWGYTFLNYIHPSALISEDAILGEGNNILEGVIIEQGCTLGNANLFFGGSMVGHESTIGSYVTFAGKSMVAGCVEIGDNCFLGVSSAVKDHVKFEDHVLLGAMAYGFKSLNSGQVVAPPRSEIMKDKTGYDYL